MRKLILSVLFGFLSLFVAQAAIAGNPVLDPISDQEIPLNGTVYLPVGVTDVEGRKMDLTATGPNVVSVTVIDDLPGRLNAVVQLRGMASASNNTLSINGFIEGQSAICDNKSFTVSTGPTILNLPIRFDGIRHQKLAVNNPYKINFRVDAGDSSVTITSLTWNALPTGASMSSFTTGQRTIDATLSWTPTATQSFYLTLTANRSDGRVAKATMRLDVVNSGSNYPAILSPVSDMEIPLNQTAYIPIVATSAPTDNVSLYVLGNGASLTNVSSASGRTNAVIQLAASSTPAIKYITVAAKTAAGAVTLKQINLYYGPTILNLPVRFDGINSQIFYPNNPNRANFHIDAGDSSVNITSLNWSPLPTGMTVSSFTTGQRTIDAAFNWTPSSSQNGLYDIILTATRSDGVVATATLRIHVFNGISGSAPVLDPISDMEVPLNQTMYIPTGALGIGNIDLSVVGHGASLVDVSAVPGRTNAVIQMAPSSVPTIKTINILALDVNGLATVKQVNVHYGPTILNLPIRFDGIVFTTLFVNSSNTIPVHIDAGDSSVNITSLNWSPLPTGMTVSSFTTGQRTIDAAFNWTPSSSQNGLYDIILTATRSDGVVATATMKLLVTSGAGPISLAPGFEPISDQELALNQTGYVNIGASDPINGNVDLYVSGHEVSLINPITSTGRTDALLQLNSSSVPGIKFVNLVAKTTTGGISIKQMVAFYGPTILNQPITMDSLCTTEFYTGTNNTVSFHIDAGDSSVNIASLYWSPLPTGATISSFTTGQRTIDATLSWNPSQSGLKDIIFTAVRSDGVVASALLRLAVTQPPPPVSATFLRTDTTTKGNWKGVYGSQGYKIINHAESYPVYNPQITFFGADYYTWASSTTDVRAIQKAGTSTDRIAATAHSSTAFEFLYTALGQPDTIHQVALYLLDWDNYAGGRAQKVEVINGNTGAVLNTQNVSAFSGGKYLVYNIQGYVKFRITYTGPVGGNAVLSGIFLDPQGTAPAPCFIATAAYGTDMEPQVDSLRNFRNGAMMTNKSGQEAVDWYYHTSPPLANELKKHDGLRAATRGALTPLIKFTEWWMNK